MAAGVLGLLVRAWVADRAASASSKERASRSKLASADKLKQAASLPSSVSSPLVGSGAGALMLDVERGAGGPGASPRSGTGERDEVPWFNVRKLT